MCVMGGDEEMGKQALETLVVEHGGRITQHPGQGRGWVFCLILSFWSLYLSSSCIVFIFIFFTYTYSFIYLYLFCFMHFDFPSLLSSCQHFSPMLTILFLYLIMLLFSFPFLFLLQSWLSLFSYASSSSVFLYHVMPIIFLLPLFFTPSQLFSLMLPVPPFSSLHLYIITNTLQDFLYP